MAPGGLLLTSHTVLFTPFTSLMIRVAEPAGPGGSEWRITLAASAGSDTDGTIAMKQQLAGRNEPAVTETTGYVGLFQSFHCALDVLGHGIELGTGRSNLDCRIKFYLF
jgi:hypothetical protein